MSLLKQSLILSILFFTLTNCEDVLKNEDEQAILNKSDSWISSGGQDSQSYRNIHYTFSLTKATDISLELVSEINGYIYCVDDLGFNVIKSDDDEINKKLEPGNYELIVATRYIDQSGVFQLNYSGIDNLVKVNAKYEETIGSWINSGGQEPNSFRNIHYDIAVNKETTLDVVVNSEVDNYIYLVDELGFVTENNSIFTNNTITKKVSPGNYKLVVATRYKNQPKEGVSNNFVISTFGQYTSIKKLDVSELSIQGSWVNSGGRDHSSDSNPKFNFRVNDKSFVDIVISQPTSNKIDEFVYLIKPNGDIIETSSDWMLIELEPGNYSVVIGTRYSNKSGNFILEMYGSDISNLRKD